MCIYFCLKKPKPNASSHGYMSCTVIQLQAVCSEQFFICLALVAVVQEALFLSKMLEYCLCHTERGKYLQFQKNHCQGKSEVQHFGLTLLFLYLITLEELIFTWEIIHKFINISIYIQNWNYSKIHKHIYIYSKLTSSQFFSLPIPKNTLAAMDHILKAIIINKQKATKFKTLCNEKKRQFRV